MAEDNRLSAGKGLALAVIGPLLTVGGVAVVAGNYTEKINSNATSIVNTNVRIDRLQDQTDKRLERMEGKLDVLIQNTNTRRK